MNKIKNGKQRIILATALVFLFVFMTPLFFASAAQNNYQYKPLEGIPGFENIDVSNFPDYILAIYKFGIWTVGIAAVLMITIGGFVYFTSAGNTSRAGTGKQIITDALIGLVVALFAYLILFVINPDLVNIRLSFVKSTGISGRLNPITGTPVGSVGATNGYSKVCQGSPGTNPINFSQASGDKSIKLASTCDQYGSMFNNNGSGVDPCLLRAIAQLESGCGRNKGPSGEGSCGLMQLLPSTASRMAGKNVTCDELKNNDDLSVQLAAKYISQNLGSGCVAKAKDKNSAIFAGYNSGYECGGSACSPKKHAMCQSSDCPGVLAFECCINPGGLSESITYAWNGIGLLNQCK